MSKNIAVLLTCHNRKEKTLACLTSFYQATLPKSYQFEIFIVDDGSTDGTAQAVKKQFPRVSIIRGNGNLYWAGGMRLAWQSALDANNFDAFLLLNDDVVLSTNFLEVLIASDVYSVNQTGKHGIYSSATADRETGAISYGGHVIKRNDFLLRTEKLVPTELPQVCDISNANILWVSKEVVEQIGIFDKKFTHGIADYDYSYSAVRKGIPVFLSSGVGGYCTDDHGVNWKSSKTSLKERIAYLKSPLGLAYKEYLYYIRRNFPLYLPYAFSMLWFKTLFPLVWEKLK